MRTGEPGLIKFGDKIIPQIVGDFKTENVVSVDGGAMSARAAPLPTGTSPNEDACPTHKLTYYGSWSWPIPAARRLTCWR